MKQKSIKIIFFGSGDVAAKHLDLIKDRFEIAAVITKNVHTNDVKNTNLVEKICKMNDFKYYYANNKNEVQQKLEEIAELPSLGIVIDYGVIISEDSIKMFTRGIINSHFSLLPKYRGADPITYALLNGDQKTGVSIMLISKGLDDGLLLAEKELLISPDDDNSSLTSKLIDLSDKLLAETVDKYLIGDIKPYEQDHEGVSHTTKLTPEMAYVEALSMPAKTLYNHFRAFKDWPKTKIRLQTQELILTEIRPLRGSTKPINLNKFFAKLDSNIYLICAQGSYLELITVQIPGKKVSPILDFYNGYRGLFK